MALDLVMADETEALTSTRRCAFCGKATDLRTPHVIIEGNAVRAFCSAECAARAAAPPIAIPEPPRRRGRVRAWLPYVLRLGVGLPLLVFTSGHDAAVVDGASTVAARAVVAPASKVAPAPDPNLFGPRWPPTEQDWLAEISADTWIHPLDGPNRRMPVSDSRVFGAERPGDRPGECRNGHCGVDLSGYWGEPVHAVHDGIVDRVQRGPNEEHGGLYVRIAHRDGSIFSQYFHLCAIPRAIEPGAHIRVGDLIGLVGDSGVKHSAPHLHFTLSVRPSASQPDKFMDPEPLIALWPLRFATGESSSVVSTRVAPGVPHGAATTSHHHHRHALITPSASSTADEATSTE